MGINSDQSQNVEYHEYVPNIEKYKWSEKNLLVTKPPMERSVVATTIGGEGTAVVVIAVVVVVVILVIAWGNQF